MDWCIKVTKKNEQDKTISFTNSSSYLFMWQIFIEHQSHAWLSGQQHLQDEQKKEDFLSDMSVTEAMRIVSQVEDGKHLLLWESSRIRTKSRLRRRSLVPFFFLFLFFFFWLLTACGSSLGQGSNLFHSRDLSHSSDNAGSLTCCASRELHWYL